MRTVFRRLWKTGLWLGALIAVGVPLTTLVVMVHDRNVVGEAERCMNGPSADRQLEPGRYWQTPDGLRAYVIEERFSSLGVSEVPKGDLNSILAQGYRPATMQEIFAKKCDVWRGSEEGKTTYFATNAMAWREMYTREQHGEYFFLSLLGVLPLIVWWGLGKWVGWLAAPGAQTAASSAPAPPPPPAAQPASADTAKRDAMELLGWNGESMSDEAFKRLRKNAMNLWHPDKREAYVASTGRSAAYFDSMSARVMAALQWLEQNAVTETGNVVGW
jgi:hypothetical protein